MAELTNRRKFTVELVSGEETNLTTRFPTNEELQDGEFEFSKSFNNAIINGILPEARLLAELMKNGIWDETKDQAIEDQRVKVVGLEEALSETEGSEKVSVAETLGAARQELFGQRQARSELFAHSAEAKAEQAQRDVVVSRVTEYEKSGAPVWLTFETYRKEQDNNLLFRATYEYMTFESGLDANFIEQLPENQTASDATEQIITDEETEALVTEAPVVIEEDPVAEEASPDVTAV